MPGPSIPSKFDTVIVKRGHEEKDGFGGRCRRFESRILRERSPGPGSYTPQKGMQRCSSKKSPFQAASLRFRERIETTPGPGDYKLLRPLKKRTLGARSSTPSARSLLETAPASPGPGHYHLQERRERRRPQSMFVSRMNRLNVVEKFGNPAPGAYDVRRVPGKNPAPAFSRSKVRRTSGFDNPASVVRVDNRSRRRRRKVATPGPGEYDCLKPSPSFSSTLSSSSLLKYSRSRLRMAPSSSRRRLPKISTETPGPGWYEPLQPPRRSDSSSFISSVDHAGSCSSFASTTRRFEKRTTSATHPGPAFCNPEPRRNDYRSRGGGRHQRWVA